MNTNEKSFFTEEEEIFLLEPYAVEHETFVETLRKISKKYSPLHSLEDIRDEINEIFIQVERNEKEHSFGRIGRKIPDYTMYIEDSALYYTSTTYPYEGSLTESLETEDKIS